MEKISLIKKDLYEKSGKEWLGLPKKTEVRLESLVRYLDHPKLQENSRLVEEIIKVYYLAKESNFIKMEGVNRKLDQLSIKFSRESSLQKTGISQSQSARGEPVVYEKAIEKSKKQVDNFLSSTLGMSLPEKTKKSLITFLGLLNHPKLVKKNALFEEMREKYDKAKEQDFLSMSAFDSMLNKCEIKLGASTDELKAWKSPEERRKELISEREEFSIEKERFNEKLDILESELESMNIERDKYEIANKKLNQGLTKLETEKEAMKIEREKLESEKNQIKKEREELKIKQDKLDSELEKLT